MSETEPDFDKLISPDPVAFGWRTTMENKIFSILFSIIMGVLYKSIIKWNTSEEY